MRRYVAMLWIVLLVVSSVVFVSCSSEERASAARETLLQQQYSQSVGEENQILRDTNDQLREQVVTLSENASRNAALIEACTARYPYLTYNAVPVPVKVPLGDILVRQDRVIIDIPDVQQGIIAASKSMEPLLHEDNIVLEIPLKAETDVHVGDIIIYERDGMRVIHRVVSIGRDADGWYVTTKGDNNAVEDSDKVRFDKIVGVVVGVIY